MCRKTSAEVSVDLMRLNAVSRSTNHLTFCAPEEALRRSVRGAAISEKAGMNERKQLAIVRKEPKCLTVSGAFYLCCLCMLS